MPDEKTAMQLNYVSANRFYVYLEPTGNPTASFSECSGLGVSIDYDPIVEGGVNDQRRILLKEPKFQDVTLKRGITDSIIFWEWQKMMLGDGPKKRRSVSIALFNQAGQRMQCWTLIGALPVGWKVDALQASSEAIALEELTLAYEGLTIESGGSGASNLEYNSGRGSATSYFPGSS